MKKVKFLNLQNKKNSLPLMDGREITGGEVFEASLSDIPEAYRDRVQIVATIDNEDVLVANEDKTENPIKDEKPEKTGTEEKEETTDAEKEEDEKPEIEEEKQAVDVVEEMKFTPPFKKVHKGFGKYDVIDSEENVVEGNVTSIKADQILKQMKAGV